jgi:hypothetical protein
MYTFLCVSKCFLLSHVPIYFDDFPKKNYKPSDIFLGVLLLIMWRKPSDID